MNPYPDRNFGTYTSIFYLFAILFLYFSLGSPPHPIRAIKDEYKQEMVLNLLAACTQEFTVYFKTCLDLNNICSSIRENFPFTNNKQTI